MITASWDDRIGELDYLIRTGQVVKLTATHNTREIDDDYYTMCELFEAGILDIYDVSKAENIATFIAEAAFSISSPQGVFDLANGTILAIPLSNIQDEFIEKGYMT